MIYSESAMLILKESSKCDKKSHTYETDAVCSDFQDTMSGLDSRELSYTIDSLPVIKSTGGRECGECGSKCESYLIGFDMLNKICESYDDIDDEVQAYYAVCEHYGFEDGDLAVVFESDEVAEQIIEEAKSTKKCGLAKDCDDAIKTFQSKGIGVFKKKSSKKKKKK